MWVVLESIIWKNSMPHFGGLCFLVAFFLCSLSIQTKQKCFQRTIWGISSNQPIMWRFKRPSTCIKLHDSLNNSNNSHDYSIGSVIKVVFWIGELEELCKILTILQMRAHFHMNKCEQRKNEEKGMVWY